MVFGTIFKIFFCILLDALFRDCEVGLVRVVEFVKI